MKTSPISSTAPGAAGAVLAAGALAAADGDNGTEQAVADFHQQRAGVLRPLPRPAPAPAHSQRSRGAGRLQAPRQLESAVLTAVECIARGGTGDLEHWLSGCGFDALEQATLLQAVAARGDAEQRRMQPLLDRLAREHGATLRDGMAQQDWFAQAVQALDGTGRGRPDYDPAASRRLRERFKGSASGHAPTDALALDQALQALGGADAAVTVLAGLRRSVAGDPGLRRAGADSARVWLSLREAANFNLLQSCYHYGADLHAALVQADAYDAGGNEAHGVARAARGLLRAGEVDGVELAGLVGIAPAAPGRAAHRLLAAAVRHLPLTLWPGARERSTLLAALDDAPAGPRGAEMDDTRVSRRLNAAWMARHG